MTKKNWGILFLLFTFYHVNALDLIYVGPYAMQLRIINQTDNEVKIILNELNNKISINGNENYYSEILIMDFANIYPLFFGIEYEDNNVKYYAFKRPADGYIRNFIYYVIINNSDDYYNGLRGINIFSEYSYLEFINQTTQLRYSYSDYSSGWLKIDNRIDNQNNYLEILVINNTTRNQEIIFNDHEREIFFELEIGEARLIRIFHPLFLQGNVHKDIDYKYFSIKTNYVDCPIERQSNPLSLLHPIAYGTYRNIIRAEEKMLIIRLREMPDGNVGIWFNQ
jgi:hypothetical protein